MLVRDESWNKIRDQFTDDEKQQLRKAASGNIICPPGTVLDEAQVDPTLAHKLSEALKKVAKR